MISVVVPAHNEQAVIGRLLEALRPGIDADELEVVVVANGCTDDTAAAARVHDVEVIELEQGHKPGALNAGDEAVLTFPRFYVDADVVVSADDIVAMAACLDADGVEAVAPRLVVDSSGASFVVRSYHHYWQELPGVRHSLAGRGCFGVTEHGRARWETFPDLVADDQFVNLCFTPSERTVHNAVGSVVTTPADVASLVARKQRSHLGNLDLAAVGRAGATSRRGWLQVLARHPRRIIDLPAFLYVTFRVRLAARGIRGHDVVDWGADRSSRARAAPIPPEDT